MRKHFPSSHLECPLSVSVNPHLTMVKEGALRWVQHFQLFTQEDILHRLDLAAPWDLSARVYPHLSSEKLQVITDWLVWAVIYDALWCDEIEGNARHVERLVSLQHRLIDVLKEGWTDHSGHISGGESLRWENSLIEAWRNIIGRLREVIPNAELYWFTQSFDQYFQATMWEVMQTLNHTTPEQSLYVKLRPFSGGGYAFLEFRHLLEGVSSLDIRKNVFVRQLEAMANNHVLWSNDIFSYPKEVARGATSNLVWIVQEKSRLSIDQAIQHVVSMCNAEMRAYSDLRALLPELGKIDSITAAYLSFLDDYVGGHLDWVYKATHRYD